MTQVVFEDINLEFQVSILYDAEGSGQLKVKNVIK